MKTETPTPHLTRNFRGEIHSARIGNLRLTVSQVGGIFEILEYRLGDRFPAAIETAYSPRQVMTHVSREIRKERHRLQRIEKRLNR